MKSMWSQKKLTNYPIKNAMDNYYALYSYNELKNFFNVISGKGFTNWFANLFNKASDSIGSLRLYPIKSSALGFLNEHSPSTTIGGQSWEIDTYNISSETKMHTIGHYEFPKPESFIDLEPYTQVQLFIPFMEFIELPMNELAGNTLEVQYYVDLPTGTATAYIYIIRKDGAYTYRTMIAMKSGKIGVDIAWGKDNSVENSRNVINTALSTAVSLATMYATKGASTVAQATVTARAGAELSKGLLSVANSLQTRFERGGTTGSFISLASPTATYLIIKKPKLVPVDEDDYAHTYGKPLYESRVLAQVSGYTVIDEIHLTGLPDALDDEVNEIERLLKEGVHL